MVIDLVEYRGTWILPTHRLPYISHIEGALITLHTTDYRSSSTEESKVAINLTRFMSVLCALL